MSTYVPGISFSAFTDIRKPVLLAKAPVSEKGEYEETIFGTSLPENRR